MLNGHVAPGDVVAVVGAGPIGLSAIMGARLLQPEPRRRDRPRRQPARRGQAVRRRRRRQQRRARTRRRRARAHRRARRRRRDRGGRRRRRPSSSRPSSSAPAATIANIGVHGKPATLHLEDAVDQGRDDHDRAGRHLLDADAPAAARRPASSTPTAFVTHRFALDEFMRGVRRVRRRRPRPARSRSSSNGLLDEPTVNRSTSQCRSDEVGDLGSPKAGVSLGPRPAARPGHNRGLGGSHLRSTGSLVSALPGLLGGHGAAMFVAAGQRLGGATRGYARLARRPSPRPTPPRVQASMASPWR